MSMISKTFFNRQMKPGIHVRKSGIGSRSKLVVTNNDGGLSTVTVIPLAGQAFGAHLSGQSDFGSDVVVNIGRDRYVIATDIDPDAGAKAVLSISKAATGISPFWKIMAVILLSLYLIGSAEYKADLASAQPNASAVQGYAGQSAPVDPVVIQPPQGDIDPSTFGLPDKALTNAP